MLCSKCNKNTAVVFVNKLDQNGRQEMQGLCYQCAKSLGINPLDALAKQANLSETDLEDMTSQFESMFKDISENMTEEDINNLMAESEDAINEMDSDSLGSIFSGLFGFKNNGSNAAMNNNQNANSNNSQKVKVDTKTNKMNKP